MPSARHRGPCPARLSRGRRRRRAPPRPPVPPRLPLPHQAERRSPSPACAARPSAAPAPPAVAPAHRSPSRQPSVSSGARRRHRSRHVPGAGRRGGAREVGGVADPVPAAPVRPGPVLSRQSGQPQLFTRRALRWPCGAGRVSVGDAPGPEPGGAGRALPARGPRGGRCRCGLGPHGRVCPAAAEPPPSGPGKARGVAGRLPDGAVARNWKSVSVPVSPSVPPSTLTSLKPPGATARAITSCSNSYGNVKYLGLSARNRKNRWKTKTTPLPCCNQGSECSIVDN